MIFSDYEILFKKYERKGQPLENVLSWLKNTAKIDDDVVNLVLTETMGMLSQGADFKTECKCGCGYDKEKYPDANISHYMLARAYDIKGKIAKSRIKIINDIDNTKFEARMKSLVNSDKQMFEAYHGNWSQRNLPTFRKWLGLKD